MAYFHQGKRVDVQLVSKATTFVWKESLEREQEVVLDLQEFPIRVVRLLWLCVHFHLKRTIS